MKNKGRIPREERGVCSTPESSSGTEKLRQNRAINKGGAHEQKSDSAGFSGEGRQRGGHSWCES
ncbi:MAG: hypothetical protein WB819_14105, partial [Terriglobia bacterium]